MVLMNRNIITLFCGTKVFCLAVYLLSAAVTGSFVVYIHRSLPPPPPPQNLTPPKVFFFSWQHLNKFQIPR